MVLDSHSTKPSSSITLAETVMGLMGTIRADLLVSVGFDASKAKRVFTFCMTDMGELVFLPPLIEKLSRVAPNCTIRSVQLAPKDIASALETGEVDLAIGSLHSVPSGLFQQQLFTHPFVTIVSRDNAAIGAGLTEDQFFAMPHIAVAPDAYR